MSKKAYEPTVLATRDNRTVGVQEVHPKFWRWARQIERAIDANFWPKRGMTDPGAKFVVWEAAR